MITLHRYNKLVFALLSILSIACNSKKTPFLQTEISLYQLDGKTFHLDSIPNSYATIFAFLAPGCPLSENYTLTLNNLQSLYKKNNVNLYGIIPGRLHTREEIMAFVDTFKIQFPLLLDSNYALTKYVNATITPEVFLLSPKGEIIYSGAIDNWAIELTQLRTEITNHYLRDAIDAFLKKEPVKIKHKEAIGCIIE